MGQTSSPIQWMLSADGMCVLSVESPLCKCCVKGQLLSDHPATVRGGEMAVGGEGGNGGGEGESWSCWVISEDREQISMAKTLLIFYALRSTWTCASQRACADPFDPLGTTAWQCR